MQADAGVNAQTAAIESGFVHVPNDARWADDDVAELLRFPRGRHDDQVDSTSQALAWLKRPNTIGMLVYMQRLIASQREPRPGALVRLQAPEGVTTVYTIEGKMFNVPDGYLTLPEAGVRLRRLFTVRRHFTDDAA